MIVSSWIVTLYLKNLLYNASFCRCVNNVKTFVHKMGSCVCKEKTTARGDTPTQGRNHSRPQNDTRLGVFHPSSAHSDAESSTSSGYHGSQVLMSRTVSKKTVRSLVLETLSVIRTLIDK
jgi:hypothetical protein